MVRVAGTCLIHYLQDPHHVWLMEAKPCSNWANTGYGSRGKAVYFLFFIVNPPSLQAYGTLSLEQPVGSLVYCKGTDWSCSLILIFSVIFFLFPSLTGRPSLVSSVPFIPFYPKPPKFSFLKKSVSSVLLYSEQTGEVRGSWLVRKYLAICSLQFSCQVLLLACLVFIWWGI